MAQAAQLADYFPANREEAAIFEKLSREPLHIDEIVRHTSLNTSTVMSTLTMMEMKAAARHVGGLFYVRA